jgi:hypothetical protein
MSSFDKFIEDIERRRIEREKHLESIRQAEEQHNMRERVYRYAERWQNSVRHVPPSQKGDK